MPGGSLDGLLPVVGGGLVRDKHWVPAGETAGAKSSDTLLGFETTGPCPFRGVAFRWECRRVVASLWWWGVVFDLWIVVASI